MPQLLRIGLIGCGAISGAYLTHARAFPILQFTACSDIGLERAKARALEFQVPGVLSVDEILRDRNVDIILNLTIPKAHAEISLAALSAGKHVYCEKPLGISSIEGQQILAAAKAKNLRVGCAPDTFLGAG